MAKRHDRKRMADTEGGDGEEGEQRIYAKGLNSNVRYNTCNLR